MAKGPKRLLSLAFIAYFAVFMLGVLALGWRWNKFRKPPDQPIAFSHRIHAGQLGLQCLFCHTDADKSYFAGIPSVQKCMSCHISVKTNSPEVQKIQKYWNEGKPIPWRRVHRVRIQNYVYFTHKRHVKKGIKCQRCHGAIETMSKVRQVSSLKMGWCISCHRANNALHDCWTCHK